MPNDEIIDRVRNRLRDAAQIVCDVVGSVGNEFGDFNASGPDGFNRAYGSLIERVFDVLMAFEVGQAQPVGETVPRLCLKCDTPLEMRDAGDQTHPGRRIYFCPKCAWQMTIGEREK